jgi:hypothetical protein
VPDSELSEKEIPARAVGLSKIKKLLAQKGFAVRMEGREERGSPLQNHQQTGKVQKIFPNTLAHPYAVAVWSGKDHVNIQKSAGTGLRNHSRKEVRLRVGEGMMRKREKVVVGGKKLGLYIGFVGAPCSPANLQVVNFSFWHCLRTVLVGLVWGFVVKWWVRKAEEGEVKVRRWVNAVAPDIRGCQCRRAAQGWNVEGKSPDNATS